MPKSNVSPTCIFHLTSEVAIWCVVFYQCAVVKGIINNSLMEFFFRKDWYFRMNKIIWCGERLFSEVWIALLKGFK